MDGYHGRMEDIASFILTHPDERWRSIRLSVTVVFVTGQLAGLTLLLMSHMMSAFIVANLAFLILVAYLVQMLESYSLWRQSLVSLISHHTANAPDRP